MTVKDILKKMFPDKTDAFGEGGRSRVVTRPEPDTNPPTSRQVSSTTERYLKNEEISYYGTTSGRIYSNYASPPHRNVIIVEEEDDSLVRTLASAALIEEVIESSSFDDTFSSSSSSSDSFDFGGGESGGGGASGDW